MRQALRHDQGKASSSTVHSSSRSMRCITLRASNVPASLPRKVGCWRMTAGWPGLLAQGAPLAMRYLRNCRRPAKACVGTMVQLDQDVEGGGS